MNRLRRKDGRVTASCGDVQDGYHRGHASHPGRPVALARPAR
jgi:hypothetical protein